jgi:predicted transcriptional regulator
MSTSVKMDDKTKSRLEELQARVKIETGEKVTQQELLHAIVEHALSTEQEVIEEFRETTVPASEEVIEEFHSGISSSGKETTEEDIDEVLYG